MSDLRLAALLCTRLCHDVIGPIGAINNGLELLAESSGGGMDDEVVDLIQLSAGESARRLKFFRAAFGLSRASSGVTGVDDAKRLMEGLFEGGKVELDWFEGPLPAEPASGEILSQLLLNLVLCASECLPRGGRVAVRFARQDDALAMRVAANGVSIKVTDEMRRGLSGVENIDDLDPRSVQPYLAGRLAAAMGTSLDLTQQSPETAEISAVFIVRD